MRAIRRCSWRGGANPPLPIERRLDLLRAFLRRVHRRIDLEIIRHASMHALELPPCEADQPVAARALARLEHRERREQAYEAQVECREQRAILPRLAAAEHHVVDDQ